MFAPFFQKYPTEFTLDLGRVITVGEILQQEPIRKCTKTPRILVKGGLIAGLRKTTGSNLRALVRNQGYTF